MAAEIEQLVSRIIKEQEAVIGPIAWSEAGKVTGLKLDVQNRSLQVTGESADVLDRLVKQYERLFGPASREVCRDAIRTLRSQVPEDEIPAVLK